jgi:hypothetical protein
LEGCYCTVARWRCCALNFSNDVRIVLNVPLEEML